MRKKGKGLAKLDAHRPHAYIGTVMSQQLLPVLIVVAFGALCFGCGYLAAFIATRKNWCADTIKRGAARYNSQAGKWEWGEPPKESRY